MEQMLDVEREFGGDTNYLGLLVKPDNVIVLGQRKVNDLERIGLAIIDY